MFRDMRSHWRWLIFLKVLNGHKYSQNLRSLPWTTRRCSERLLKLPAECWGAVRIHEIAHSLHFGQRFDSQPWTYKEVLLQLKDYVPDSSSIHSPVQPYRAGFQHDQDSSEPANEVRRVSPLNLEMWRLSQFKSSETLTDLFFSEQSSTSWEISWLIIILLQKSRLVRTNLSRINVRKPLMKWRRSSKWWKTNRSK